MICFTLRPGPSPVADGNLQVTTSEMPDMTTEITYTERILQQDNNANVESNPAAAKKLAKRYALAEKLNNSDNFGNSEESTTLPNLLFSNDSNEMIFNKSETIFSQRDTFSRTEANNSLKNDTMFLYSTTNESVVSSVFPTSFYNEVSKYNICKHICPVP